MEHTASLDAVRSFLVALDGSRAAMNALAATCEIARRSHASVAALHVIEVPRSLPLEAELPAEFERGEAILADAEALGRRHDVQVDGRILQARNAGVAVVDEAAALAADAIVIGLDYHRPYGKFELGQVPLYVLGNASALVWVIRYPYGPDEAPGAPA
jgi:nucleotide-binding universal stress UspA family protein